MKEVSEKLRDFATFIENKKDKIPEYRDPLAEFVSFLDKIAGKMQDISELADRADFKDEGPILAVTEKIGTMVNEVEASYASIDPLIENLTELYHTLLNSAIAVEQADLATEEE